MLGLVWLRGNLLQSELAILFGVSQATVHRILQFLVPVLACLHANEVPDSKEEFLLDGTLITVADHAIANFTRKHQRQVNVQVICDAGRRVMFVGRLCQAVDMMGGTRVGSSGTKV